METVRVSEDRRVGVRDEGIEYDTSDMARALDAISNLNGRQRTVVSLQKGHLVLTVGGGDDGRYIAFLAVNEDEQFFNLVDREADGAKQYEVTTGGQAADFPARQCIDLQAARTAATYFLMSGAMNPAQSWEEA